MTENKNVPRIRFDGFNDAWEQRKLSEGTSKISDGLHGTPTYTDSGDVFFINGNNLVNGKIKITKETKMVSESEQTRDDKLLNDNTILMSINGTIGNLAWYRNERVMLGKSAAYLIVSDFDKRFIYSYLQTSVIKNYFLNNLTGTTIKNLGLKTIKNTQIFLPNTDEQQKVGSFFQQLDRLIALHQRKLDLLKEIKKSMMQKIFDQTWRFEGFTDPWEERKLEDVVEKQIKGKAQFEKLAPGEVEYLDTSRLNGGQAILTNGLKDVTLDDILILWDGSKAGTVYHGFEGALGSTLKAYRTSANSKFVYQYLKRHQDNIYNNYRTPNIPHVQKDFLNVFTISVPVSDEQEKIGLFFKQLDDTIDLHQLKIDKLKEIKKWLMQNMFV